MGKLVLKQPWRYFILVIFSTTGKAKRIAKLE